MTGNPCAQECDAQGNSICWALEEVFVTTMLSEVRFMSCQLTGMVFAKVLIGRIALQLQRLMVGLGTKRNDCCASGDFKARRKPRLILHPNMCLNTVFDNPAGFSHVYTYTICIHIVCVVKRIATSLAKHSGR